MSVDELESSELYSEELGIDLESRDDGELFKWFLASVLFGGRISEKIAERTYHTFEDHDLLTLEAILDAGFDFLVDPVMREGGMSVTTISVPDRSSATVSSSLSSTMEV